MHSTSVQGCMSESSERDSKRARQKGRNERDVGIVQFDKNAITGSTNSTLRQRKTTLQKIKFYAPHQNCVTFSSHLEAWKYDVIAR